MIIVGIISILSLMALPSYQNYIIRVKLTNLMADHLSFVRNLEMYTKVENDRDAIISYIQSLCKDGKFSSSSGTTRECVTAGDPTQSIYLYAAVGSGDMTFRIHANNYSSSQPGYYSHSVSITDKQDGHASSDYLFLPLNPKEYNLLSKDPTKNKIRMFFYKPKDNGDTTGLPKGFNCYFSFYGSDYFIPKGVRPTACKNTLINGSYIKD